MTTGAVMRMNMEPQAMQLGMLAHDLRTPISCICGAAQVALESARRGAKVEEYLSQILSAANALEAMTGELLDERQTHSEPVDASMLERELRALMQPRAAARDQQLVIDMGALAGRRLEGDAPALMRILTNLVSNALKYTQRGGRIEVLAQVEDDNVGGFTGAENGVRTPGKGAVTAVFTVRDNGVGMTQEFMQSLFQPFARAKETEAIEGHGLGLASVKRLAERMRGTVEVSSRFGEGTAFTLRVPLQEDAPAQKAVLTQEGAPQEGAALRREEVLPRESEPLAPARTACESFRGQRILLAEDNALGAQILESLLSAREAQVSLARDGAEAVRLFAESEPGAYTAVLMDMHMPRLDGCEASRAIREMRRQDARCVPIVAMTAGGGEADMRRAREAGMDACLGKPLNMQKLCAILARE